MDPITWIALAGLVISTLGTIGNEVGNAKQAKRASDSAEKMRNLSEKVAARNKVLQSDIDALASAIAGANQLGAAVDSRISPKIQKNIAEMNYRMRNSYNEIADNNSKLSQGAELSTSGNPGGIAGFFDDAGFTRNIDKIDKLAGDIK